MKINEEFYPIIILEEDGEKDGTPRLKMTFRTPSAQFWTKMVEEGKDKDIRSLMERYGDNLDTRLEHMSSMLPKGQV